MANKKLRVEVELDTAKAKRQAKELEKTGGEPSAASPTIGNAAKKFADNLDRSSAKIASSFGRAAKMTDEMAESSKRMSAETRSLIRGFAGIGAGMAMSYAANFMPQGRARENVEVGASAVQGASAAAMLADFLPWGKAAKMAVTGVGGLIGGATKKAEQDKAAADYSAEWKKSEATYKEATAFADMIREMTNVKDGFAEFETRLKEINDELVNRRAKEGELIQSINEAIEARQYDKANALRGDLAANRAQQDALRNAARTIEAMSEKQSQKDEKSPEAIRTSTSALDSLGGVGGAFVGSFAAAAAAGSAAKRRRGAGGGATSAIPAFPGFSVPTGRGFDETEFSSRTEGLMSASEQALRTGAESVARKQDETNKLLAGIKASVEAKENGLSWR